MLITIFVLFNDALNTFLLTGMHIYTYVCTEPYPGQNPGGGGGTFLINICVTIFCNHFLKIKQN